ncbi:hypothetical protein AKJ16_DCAP22113 [Drosera capensis]
MSSLSSSVVSVTISPLLTSATRGRLQCQTDDLIIALIATNLYARRHFLVPPLKIKDYNEHLMAVVRCEEKMFYLIFRRLGRILTEIPTTVG